MSARERLEDNGIDEEILLIDDDAYNEALIGVTSDNEMRAVYDFNVMVREFADYHKCTEEEAQEYIEFNVIRALPYYGDKAPVIIYPLEL